MEYDISILVSNVLRELCVPNHIAGFRYLHKAIIQTIEKQDTTVKKLYDVLALNHSVSVSRIERSMRYAIASGWQRASGDVKQCYFGSYYCGTNRPSNLEYVATIAEHVKNQWVKR